MSNQNKPVRVLCAGDVNGKFKQLISRVSAVNKKVILKKLHFKYFLRPVYSTYFFVWGNFLGLMIWKIKRLLMVK